MSVWRIDAKTEGREVYYVEADTEDEAVAKFEDGDVPDPVVSEVLHAWISEITEQKEEA